MDASPVVKPSAKAAWPRTSRDTEPPSTSLATRTSTITASTTTSTPKPSTRPTLAPLEPPADAQDAGLAPAGISQGHASLAVEKGAKLLGKTLRMRVDVSGIECGCVVGVYLVEWGDGGACDASGSFPERCGEIDLMEGNKHSWHSTLHNPVDQAGQGGGIGGVGQPDQNFGAGPRDMTSAQYGPGGSVIDTEQPFNAAVSFPQKDDGSLADMVVILYQDGKDTAIEWRVNKPRADPTREPPLTCEEDSCPNCFRKPGCHYKEKDLKIFAQWLSQGMTPLSTYWDYPGNGWLDGAMPGEEGMCALDGKGKLGTQEKGGYAGASGCNGASYSIDSFTVEELQEPNESWEDFFERMDNSPEVQLS